MQRTDFITTKVTSDDLAVTNRVFFNPADYDPKRTPYIKVAKSTGGAFLMTGDVSATIKPGYIGTGLAQRKWAELSLEERVHVFPFTEPPKYIIGLNVVVDFMKNKVSDPLDSDAMAREFLAFFANFALTADQQVFFPYIHKNTKLVLLVVVKEIFATADLAGAQKVPYAVLSPNSSVVFDKKPDSALNLIGKSKGKSTQRALINPDWDFQKIGIGGLDKEFSHIFRRAFASRLFPPEVAEQLEAKHVRGILLYGPPGTGKTLIARQIGKMLNAREPKIVNGPELLNKYVGESEANMRKLFAEAEEEWRRCGPNSGLHIIIFDEIDAICKQRGSQAGSTGVHDTMVNQLLTKLDGIEQLNNILVIGMTNRKDMIDEALLRPGRMEVQLEISLPDKHGRAQILRIHTARMREYNKLGDDVDLEDIAERTKNFSGAEIEGLVRAAQSSAMNRLIKVGNKVEVEEDAFEKLKVTNDDFDYALTYDIKPAFGTANEQLEAYLRDDLIHWDEEVNRILAAGMSVARGVQDDNSKGYQRVLFHGAPNTGKTSLVAKIAHDSGFPFVKIISPANMIGYSENAKSQLIHRMFNDAYKSPLSVLIIDSIELLIDYSPVGPRFSNGIVITLRTLLQQKPPVGKRLLVLATTSSYSFMCELGIDVAFNAKVHVPKLKEPKHYRTVALNYPNLFNEEDCNALEVRLAGMRDDVPAVGIKDVLDLLDSVRSTSYPLDEFLQYMEDRRIGIQ